MAGAKQIKYTKGQYVLKEGQSTAALYQIVQVRRGCREGGSNLGSRSGQRGRAKGMGSEG